MKIGVPLETTPGETRVALTPLLVTALLRDKHEVMIETGAGLRASFTDAAYLQAGATIVPDAKPIWAQAEMIFKVQPPRALPNGQHEADALREGVQIISFLAPFANAEVIKTLARRKVTAYSMEFVPRITRAQSMDALSSQATVAGYKAVLVGAEAMPKMFPLLMTAAGTIAPANVLILGVGVAGLQAIATAKRLGAKVEAFDPRPAVKEQVKSLGATFVEMEMPKDAETAGGYAKELSPEFIQKEMEAIGGRLPKMDLVICTAQIFGKKAPLLITGEMVKLLRPGSVIVDFTGDLGGNCELTQPGKTIDVSGVTLIGAVNLPATVPLDASGLYAKNVCNLFKHLYPKPDSTPDVADDIVKGACLTRGGEIVNETLKKTLSL
ncbi:MAG: Re/Si-specific NAD(P)(+) transhydrogenase subunit alpha [Verrucomicrobiota bacterium]|nr:Re/Si-specific NAD(P)(+) transhydrogenase subunit alpha [Verrucomicrobiota bacterium]